MEPDVHYRLIKQIERFPALYNYNLPDYANKLVCDKLWEQVARKTNSTVGECKEKWRNIRSSFIRSRKAPVNGSRPKKTYYLAEHLSFILPYIKARDIIPYEDDKEQENIEEGDTQSQDCNFDTNKSEEDDFEGTIKEDNEIFFNEPYPMSLSSVRSRKRRLSEDETSEYVKRKDNRKAEKQKHPMHYFFLSLSDEFDTMDERQLRQFKIKVLQALDEIKSKKEMPLGISSPACSTVTSQNIVAYSTKNLRENNRTHFVGSSASSAKSRETKDKDIIEVNIQDAQFDEDSVIKLENDIAFD